MCSVALSVLSQSEHRDWHVLSGDGDLTLRIRSGSHIGEDEFGELRFRVSAQGCWIEFTIDDQGNLWAVTVGASYQFDLGAGERVNRVRLEPGARIELPNNLLYISASMQRTTSSGVVVTLTSVAVTDIETVVGADYLQDPLFSEQQRSNELIETPELLPQPAAVDGNEWPGGTEPIRATTSGRVDRTLENDRPVPLSRYKWFLLGPLMGVAILIAMSIWIGLEPISKSSPIIPATTRVAPVLTNQVPERQQHTNPLDTQDRILVDADPEDGPVLDIATDSFAAVLLSDPLNVRAPVGLAKVEEQLSFTSKDDVGSAQQAALVDEAAANKIEPTQPTPPIDQPTRIASSATARIALLQAEQLLNSGDIIAPRGNNAVALIRRALGEEPQNTHARQLLAKCADQLIALAQRARAIAMDYEARNLLEEVLAFYPNHPEATELWREWVDS